MKLSKEIKYLPIWDQNGPTRRNLFLFSLDCYHTDLKRRTELQKMRDSLGRIATRWQMGSFWSWRPQEHNGCIGHVTFTPNDLRTDTVAGPVTMKWHFCDFWVNVRKPFHLLQIWLLLGFFCFFCFLRLIIWIMKSSMKTLLEPSHHWPHILKKTKTKKKLNKTFLH